MSNVSDSSNKIFALIETDEDMLRRNKTSRQRLPDDGNAVACLCRSRLFISW